jgi:hypothetical protein
MRQRTFLVAAVLLAAVAPSALHAQDLDAVVNRVTSAWSRGDVSAIARLAANGGMSLDVDGVAVGPVAARQATAVLRRLFDAFETDAVQRGMTRTAGGSPQRAFSELAWTARVRGTSISQRRTVFVAYVREDDGWRISQIRLMR